MTIALATADAATLSADPDDDMPLLIDALYRAGVEAVATDWRSEQDWGAFDLVVLRSPWNYAAYFGEFQQWLDHVHTHSRLLNTRELLHWNLNKRYMADLEAGGVPIVPTQFVSEVPHLHKALADLGARRVVIKPSVSAGSKDTGLFDVEDPAAVELGSAILRSGRTVMVQPEIPSISTSGEKALIYFDGTFSHAVHKGPILNPGGGLIGGAYQEVITSTQATPAEIKVGETVLQVASEVNTDASRQPPLYARIDLADGNGKAMVLEAEMVEPSCFLRFDEGAAARFAAAISRRCG